jgi:hypothetical protein
MMTVNGGNQFTLLLLSVSLLSHGTRLSVRSYAQCDNIRCGALKHLTEFCAY